MAADPDDEIQIPFFSVEFSASSAREVWEGFAEVWECEPLARGGNWAGDGVRLTGC